MPNPIIARLQKVGIAKETAWGTAAGAPTYTVRFKDIKGEIENKIVKDEGLRGVNAKLFDTFDGTHEGSIDLNFEVFPEDVPLFIKSIMGLETNSGSTNPYTHNFALANVAQPPSLTIFHDTGYEVRVFAGCVAESIAFKWAKDAGLEASVKYKSKPWVIGSQWVPSFAATQQWIGWQTTVTLAGTSNQKMVGFDITIKRELYVQHAANNTQIPTAIVAGALEVSGKATFDVVDDTELNLMLNNQKPALLVAMNQPSAITPVAAPTLALAANVGSTLPVATYYVVFSWANVNGETGVSPETSLPVTSGNQLNVTIPALPAGITAGNIYISSTTNTETKQGSTATTLYSQSIPLVAGVAKPTQNGLYGPMISFQMSKCAFMKDTESGKTVFEGDVSWEGITNATDGLSSGISPCQITVTNAVSTAY